MARGPARALATVVPAAVVSAYGAADPASEAGASIGRHWPSASDFRPGEVLTKPNPELRWLRAAGSWMGYRFSVWIAAGPEAAREDRDVALKSAASLALSGCWRETYDDCPDG